MNISQEIKEQTEIAITLQREILEGLQANTSSDKNALDKIKIINLTFDNFLKIRETLNIYLGDIESEEYISEDDIKNDDDCIYK
jgi:hypothetical protein